VSGKRFNLLFITVVGVVYIHCLLFVLFLPFVT